MDGHFRLWYVDNALHGDQEHQESPGHTVSYLGVLHQALRDLCAWVERDEAPPSSTRYEVVDAQVVIPPSAHDRCGVQPAVTLAVDGGPRADVSVGASVTLRATAEMPGDAGQIVRFEWHSDDDGTFALEEIVRPAAATTSVRQHSFSAPGTYFVSVRVIAHRDGDATTQFARLQNVARARVVVA